VRRLQRAAGGGRVTAVNMVTDVLMLGELQAAGG
jgi:hypothetical protein